MIRDAAGGDAKSSRRFIEDELLAPLGFEHATFEYDSAGVPLGTIHLWAIKSPAFSRSRVGNRPHVAWSARSE